MKLKFQKDVIVNGINTVMKAVPSKTTISVLEYILVGVSTSEIKLIDNDMELGIEIRVEGDILEHGKIASDAELFSGITGRLFGENVPVTIRSGDKFNITIHCESSVFNIQGRDGEESAYLPYIEKDKYICLSQFTLREAIQWTVFPIASNDSSRIMAGELFEVNENQLKVVLLGGHGISIRKVRSKDHYENTKVIIPDKILSEVGKTLGGGNEKKVLIHPSINHILFEFDNTMVVSRLIRGKYFRVSQILPSDYRTRIFTNEKEFLDYIERATILIRGDDEKPLMISIGDNFTELKLNSSFGFMNAELMTRKTGKDIMIRFSSKFFIDALRVIDSKEINVYMMNLKSPYFIKGEEEGYIYLILPVNFNAATV